MTLKTYRIVEFDSNEVPNVVNTGLTRGRARDLLTTYRAENKASNTGFRYIMKRDTADRPHTPETGNHLWTGNLRSEQEEL